MKFYSTFFLFSVFYWYRDKYMFNKTVELPWGQRDSGVNTLIHELGHYFGLLHVFSKGKKVQSDYCEDTPDYNRSDYGAWEMANPEATWYEKAQRTDREGNTFVSTNIMDYDEGYMECFTADQRYRVRHVLTYSPLIPGPKIAVELDLESKSNQTKYKSIIMK